MNRINALVKMIQMKFLAHMELRSGKGEKQFQQLVQTASDPNEAIYRYVMCYPKDKNKQKNLVKRYQRQMDEQSEYAKVLKKLNT